LRASDFVSHLRVIVDRNKALPGQRSRDGDARTSEKFKPQEKITCDS
jgi:hypothetical protein